MKKVSIIVPCYNEEQTVEVFYNAITSEFEKFNYELEVIYVNDGSTDKTEELITQLCQKDKRIKLISFSRNFGQQSAIVAGLSSCTGDCALELDVDLQDPVEVIPLMLEKWEEGFEIIHGRRKKRHGESAFKKVTASMYYKFLGKITDRGIPRNTGDFKLYDRKAINAIVSLPEHDKYLRGLASWVGFKQTFIDFDRHERSAGQSHYTVKKMIKLAKAGVLSNSGYPLYLSIKIGLAFTILSLLAFATFIVLACCKIALPLVAWLFPTVTLIGSMIFVFNGITNLYIERIYAETKNRPDYIIDKKINFEE